MKDLKNIRFLFNTEVLAGYFIVMFYEHLFTLILGFILIAISLLTYVIYWRCPYCNRHLYNTFFIKRCPHCDKKLFDDY